MTLKFRLLSTTMMFGLLVAVVAPAGAFANTNVTIMGNEAFSHSRVHVHRSNRMHVRQSNRNFVLNGIFVGQNTGGNSANHNTGKNVKVDSKSGDTSTTVENTTNTLDNVANVSTCGCEQDQNINVTVRGNGAHSRNRVSVRSYKRTSVRQSNNTTVVNLVGVLQNTGGNSANGNTGSGADVSVDSGNATVNVTNTTTTGGNFLNPIP